MKRIASIISSLVLLVVVAFTMTACKPKVTNFSTEGVISSGNLGVVKDNTLYYVNRLTADRTLQGADREMFGIYKVAVDSNCTPVGESSLVFTTLAGFESGQLFIYGDYIYFTIPANVTSATGERLTDRTTFCRVGLDGKNYSEIYTNETDKEPTFSYYVKDNMLYLIVLQETNLYSIKMDKKFTVTKIDSDVASAVLSESSGEAGGADGYVFYTKEPAENFITQAGHNVYRVTPDGENPELISSGQDVSLLKLANGYLYYLLDSKIMYRTTTLGGFTTGDSVSFVSYENFMILSDGGIVAQNKDESQTWYYNWTSGTMDARCLLTSVSYELLFEDNGYIYMQNTAKEEKKYIVRINTTSSKQSVQKMTEVEVQKAGNYMHYEVIGSTLYFYEKETVKDEAGNSKDYSKLNWLVIQK